MMDKQKFEELAQLYGIEIKYTEAGQGGLFYTDDCGKKAALNDIFDLEDYTVPRRETVSFKNCAAYSTYTAIALLMSDAA